jgi:signal transduction histidine kinase
VQSERAFLSFAGPNKEVLVSRLLAVVAAACLMTAAVTRLADPGAAPGAHPRHWVVAVTCTLLGLRIVAFTARNAVGRLILVMGVCSAFTVGAQALSAWFVPAWLSTWLWWPSCALLPVVALLFPTGRLTSRWWGLVLVIAVLGLVLPMIGIGWGSWSSPATFWDDIFDGTAQGGLPVLLTAGGICCLFIALLGSALSLFVRWFRAADDERRLLVWLVVCTALLVPCLFVEMAGPGNLWVAWAVVATAFPVATLVAILWYGLYDIDLLVHRAVLFGLLTTLLGGAYLIIVLAFTSPPTPGHIIGTVAVVLLLAPLQRQLRALLDRWLFGDRADPYRALARLGEQLEDLLQPDDVLKAVARSVGSALKLPYVAVRVDTRNEHLLATSGVSKQWPQLTFPLRYDGDDMGALVVETRAPEEGLGLREQRLLGDLARQAALAARSVRLAKELQQAGDEHVEDLVYLTGEVHDNVAPGVAAVRLQVDALRRTTGRADARLGTRLGQIVEDLTTVLDEIRRVVRSVRPHGLHAGLLETVRRRASKFANEDLSVTVTPDGQFDRLSPGVEDEAYRIVSAALSNVATHANASACEVRLVHNAEHLEIDVIDDGTGIPPDAVPGVGLDSMRRRCEKRGGSFGIERLSRGTRISAVLPLGTPTTNAIHLEDADGR